MREGGFKADELEQLRRWGSGLQTDAREEVAAAGRAIVLLIEEIERLHVLAWDRRLYPEEDPQELPSTLRERLRQRIRPHPGSADHGPFHR